MNKLFSFIILLIIGVTIYSCSKNLDSKEEYNHTKLRVNIPAMMASSKAVEESGVTSFSMLDKVAVYNWPHSLDRNHFWDSEFLYPDSDGVSVNLQGSLAGTYQKGDSLLLIYNTSLKKGDFENAWNDGVIVVDYTKQNGILGNVKDAAFAKVEVVSVNDNCITTTKAHFEALQSIFKLTFKYGNKDLKIKYLTIYSDGDNLIDSYTDYLGKYWSTSPNGYNHTLNCVNISYDSALTTVYVSLSFQGNPSDLIVFSVVDEDGKVYTGSKAAPVEGFKNGRFYTSTIFVTPHLFSVSEDKKVYLAPGNLYVDYEDNERYKFCSAQWDNNQNFDYKTTVGLSLYKVSVYNIKGWRIPNANEWSALVAGEQSRSYRRKYPDNENAYMNAFYITPGENTNISFWRLGGNYRGTLILPDDFNYYQDRAELENDAIKYKIPNPIYEDKHGGVNVLKYIAKGCVFLPCSASRDASVYWINRPPSSSTFGEQLIFNGIGNDRKIRPSINDYGWDDLGRASMPIRLIHDEI
jgi:hypothetical protein